MGDVVLNWATFAGVLASLATILGLIVKVVLDNKALSNNQKDLKSQSQRLKNELASDHDRLLSKQIQANQALASLDSQVGFISDNVRESNKRLEDLNISESKAYQATELLRLFLDEAKKERLLLEERVAYLERENRQLRQELREERSYQRESLSKGDDFGLELTL